MQNFLSNFIEKLFGCFYNEDTTSLLSLLNPSQDSQKFELIFRNITDISEIHQTISDNIRLKLKDEKKHKSWTDFLCTFFMYRINFFRESFFTAFENLKDSFIVFQDVYKSLETPKFLTAILKFYMRTLFFTSIIADNQNFKNNNIKCRN